MPSKKSPVVPAKTEVPERPKQGEEICIRPQKPMDQGFSLRLPFHGKVGSSEGLSLLRYRVAPATIPASVRSHDRPDGEGGV